MSNHEIPKTVAEKIAHDEELSAEELEAVAGGTAVNGNCGGNCGCDNAV